jgi:hypothetical protein
MRPGYLALAGLVSLGTQLCVTAAAEPAKPAFPHIILNNDLSNWDNTFGEGNGVALQGDPIDFVHDAFERSVAAGALPGVDAQSLSVQYSMFPWWRSSLYNWADHDRFLRRLAYYAGAGDKPGYPGEHPSSGRRYMESGHDFVRDFLDGAPGPGGQAQLKILDFRLNDYHYNWNYELYSAQSKAQILAEAKAGNSPICDGKSPANVELAEKWTQTSFTGYFDGLWTGKLDPALDGRCVGSLCLSGADIADQCKNLACIIKTDKERCPEITLDFSKAVVRRIKLMQIGDLVRTYKPPALELDLDRMPQDFRDDTPNAERLDIMTKFLQDVRNATAAVNPAMLLGLRVPAERPHRALVGIDLADLDRRHLVDYAILAMPYFGASQIDYDIDPHHAALKIYPEMTHVVGRMNPPEPAASREVSFHLEDPTTTMQLETAANLAYSHGAAGMALFNMQYYLRINGHVGKLEIPAKAITCLADPQCVAGSDQEYALVPAHYNLPRTATMLPFRLSAKTPTYELPMDLAPPATGWKKTGALLRVGFDLKAAGSSPPLTLADYQAAASNLSIRIQGRVLERSDTAWPIDPRDGGANDAYYKAMWLADADLVPRFALDPSLLKPGANKIEIGWHPVREGVLLNIVDFELYLPASR